MENMEDTDTSQDEEFIRGTLSFETGLSESGSFVQQRYVENSGCVCVCACVHITHVYGIPIDNMTYETL